MGLKGHFMDGRPTEKGTEGEERDGNAYNIKVETTGKARTKIISKFLAVGQTTTVQGKDKRFQFKAAVKGKPMEEQNEKPRHDLIHERKVVLAVACWTMKCSDTRVSHPEKERLQLSSREMLGHGSVVF